MHYFKSLNTLRAIAVLMVVFQHWNPINSLIPRLLTGPFGVDIFFTVSGFLITGIILKDIAIYRQLNRPMSTLIGHFFARRVLRILPAYALALALTFLLKSYLFPFHPGTWKYLLTFTFNLYIFRQPSWPGTMPRSIPCWRWCWAGDSRPWPGGPLLAARTKPENGVAPC